MACTTRLLPVAKRNAALDASRDDRPFQHRLAVPYAWSWLACVRRVPQSAHPGVGSCTTHGHSSFAVYRRSASRSLPRRPPSCPSSVCAPCEHVRYFIRKFVRGRGRNSATAGDFALLPHTLLCTHIQIQQQRAWILRGQCAGACCSSPLRHQQSSATCRRAAAGTSITCSVAVNGDTARGLSASPQRRLRRRRTPWRFRGG